MTTVWCVVLLGLYGNSDLPWAWVILLDSAILVRRSDSDIG